MEALSNTYILIAVSFLAYFVISLVYKRLGVNNLQTALIASNGLRLINLKHLIGIVLFGVIFYLVAPQFRYLVCNIEVPRLYVLIPILLVVFLCMYVANMSMQKHEINNLSISHYSFKNAWVYFIIRTVFLLCYEFFFRGVLLFTFLSFTSIYIAILLSTTLYVIAHAFDSRKEIIGAIPFGILLCLFTYLTNSIWYAFIIHIALSATYEINVFYYQTIKTEKS